MVIFLANQNGNYSYEPAQAAVYLTVHPYTSTENIEKSNFKVYPNPAKSELYITFDRLDEAKVSIYTSAGSLVLSKTNRSKTERLDVSELKSGLYILSTRDKNASSTHKIVIE